MNLMQTLDPKDPDVIYLNKNSHELLVDVILYFDETPEVMSDILRGYPFYEREEFTEKPRKRTLMDKIRKRPIVKPKSTIWHKFNDSKFKGMFREDNVLFDLVSMEFYTSSDIPAYFGIDLGGIEFDIPLIENVHFEPKSSFDVSYLGLDQAKILMNFYVRNREYFDNSGLDYFGFLSIGGSDDNEMNEVLERLDVKYDIFNSDEGHCMPFMISSIKSKLE